MLLNFKFEECEDPAETSRLYRVGKICILLWRTFIIGALLFKECAYKLDFYIGIYYGERHYFKRYRSKKACERDYFAQNYDIMLQRLFLALFIFD